jgi:arabinofuranosyltransferase
VDKSQKDLTSPVTKRFINAARVRFWFLLATLGALVVLQGWFFKKYEGVDDAFITYRYAEHLSDGNGLVWNENEPPLEGYSNFLWLIIHVPFVKMGVHPLEVSKVVSVLFMFLTVVTLPLFFPKEDNVFLPLMAAGVVVVNAGLAFYAQSGMETVLFSFWVTGATLLAYKSVVDGNFKWAGFGGLFALGACLTRPEGILVSVVLAVTLFYFDRAEKDYKRTALLIAVSAIPLVVYFVWKLAYFGSLVPNSVTAKYGSTMTLKNVFYGLKYLSTPFSVNFAVLIVTSFILILVLKSKLTPAVKKTSIFSFMVLAAYFSFVIAAGGDDVSAFPFGRLVIPFVPIAAFLTYRLISVTRKPLVIGVLVFATVAVTQAAPYFELLKKTTGLSSTSSYAELFKGLVFEPYRRPESPPLAEFLRRNTPPGRYIAVGWAGKVPYYSRLPVIDMCGLNDPHIATEKPKGQWGLDINYDNVYLLAREPFFIGLNVPEDRALVGDFSILFKKGDLALVRRDDFRRDYEIDIRNPDKSVTIFKSKK